MNTQLAFTFGMLAMTAICMVAAVVAGMVKVNRLEKELADVQASITKSLDNIETNLDRIVLNINRRIDDTQSTMDSRFDKFENKITKKQLLKD